MAQEPDSGIDKQKILKEIASAAPPPAPKGATDAPPGTLPPASAPPPPERGGPAVRHQVAAIVLVVVGVVWLTVALSAGSLAATGLGLAFLLPGVAFLVRPPSGKKP